uniref:Putative LOV domain-containing protein n=2 Tax=Chlamydomonadaceae TaxID=3051 RepID=A0A126X037_9CHLO|nr:putative LOV domain-containing protein [Lobochlamys segnis]AML79264.1 putative LOV domain-containing protein [Oogamochlamys gigantea]
MHQGRGGRHSMDRLPSGLAPEVNAFLSLQLGNFDFAFTISDPSQPDNPICYASHKFYSMTGYGPDEVLGRNCRFLQGPDTERRKVMEIRDALREDRSCQVCLLNYRKDGTPFFNQFFMSPIRNEEGRIIHYVGIQTDVTELVQAGCPVDAAAAQGAAAPRGPTLPRTLYPAPGDQGIGVVAAEEAREASDLQSALGSEPTVDPCPSRLPCSLLQPLLEIQQSFVLADPSLPDMPIVHVSDKFLELTGYPREQVVGRNCRFLQGPGTDPGEVAKLRAAITATPPQPVTVSLLNYRFDGRPFVNYLHVAPIRDAAGAVLFFVGVQLDVTLVPEGADAAARAEAALELRSRPPTVTQKIVHKGVTGALRVAVRSLGGDVGLRRSCEHQGLPRSGGASRTSSMAPVSRSDTPDSLLVHQPA